MRILLALCAMLAIMGAIGEADYQDEIDNEAFYCNEVNQGFIPNYKAVNC